MAAYRFGHSQVRPSYRANFGTSATDPKKQFFALIFDPKAADSADPTDPRREAAPRRFLDWQTFFDFGDGRSRRNKKIDTTLSACSRADGPARGRADLAGLPQPAAGADHEGAVGSGRGEGHEAADPGPGDLDDLKSFHLSDRTPLWFYILREADVVTDGQHLGPVGGRIVAEVIVGLVRGDHQSYLRQDPEWKPTYGSGGSFTIVDLLRVADVVAALPSGTGTGPEHGCSGPGDAT